MVGVLLDRWRGASSPNEAENQARAVSAGVAHHVWTIADLVAMMQRLEDRANRGDTPMWQGALIWLSVAMAPSAADVQIGPNVQVSQARASSVHREVVIAADPHDHARLLAAAMLMMRGVIAYRSSDGGKSWTEALVVEKATSDPRGDPVIQSISDPTIAWGPDGVYYALVYGLKANIKLPAKPAPLELRQSADAGRTWAAPARISADRLDRPFLVVDQSGGKFAGRIYCDFVVNLGGNSPRLGILTSSDGGKTFSPFHYVVPEKCSSVMSGQCAVMADGSFIVPYVVFSSAPNMFPVLDIRVSRSMTGGESFLPEQSVTTLGGNFESEGVYSLLPIIAADPGTPRFKDRLYLVWQQSAAEHYSIVFTHSNDKGVTWTKPIVISEQSDPKTSDSVLPALAVNRQGVVGVTWYDSRDRKQAVPCSNVRFRASVDGGETWLPSVRVTDVPSPIALNNPSWKLGKDGRDFTYLGETAGLTADANGDFHPAWVDKRTGLLQVFTAIVSVSTHK
jgi:hypothetical protein